MEPGNKDFLKIKKNMEAKVKILFWNSEVRRRKGGR
jgi:hypothetical protein